MLNKKKSVEPSKSTKLNDDSQIKKKSDESSKSPKSSNRLQKISKSLMLNKKKSVEPFKSAKINDDSQIQIILAETEASVKEEFKYKEMKNMAMIAHAIAGGIEAPLQFTLQVRIRIPLLSPFHLWGTTADRNPTLFVKTETELKKNSGKALNILVA